MFSYHSYDSKISKSFRSFSPETRDEDQIDSSYYITKLQRLTQMSHFKEAFYDFSIPAQS